VTRGASPAWRRIEPAELLLYHLLIAFIALAYGGLLASLPVEAFQDRTNYLNYADHSAAILQRHWSAGQLVGLANEPVWLLINIGLDAFLSPDDTLRVLIFTAASVTAWVVLRSQPRQFIWLLLFLLLPQVIKNHVVHLRQGVAVALFLVAYLATDTRAARWLLLAVTPFIHAAFFFVLVLLVLTSLAKRLRLAADLRTVIFVGAGLAVSAGIAWIASLVGARQAQAYTFSGADVSGVGFLFWSAVAALMCLQGRAFLRAHAFEIGAILFYLSTYFFIEVTARIFESVLLLVLLAGLRLTGWRRPMFLGLIASYGALTYVARMNQPWFGFG
jgi:hypothetical protein